MRALGLGLLALLFSGCVGLWGPDVPRPVVVVEPPPVVVVPAPVIVVPVVPYYYRPYYYHPYGYWRR